MIGSTISHYEIRSKLGEGGMGAVYAAEDTKLKRAVALKVLPPEIAENPDRLERFEREAQALASLNHPSIVTIHSVEEAEGLHFLTMELVEGETLDELIPKRGLEMKRFFELGIALASGLAAAHERGITHRDLKPANIMVTRDGRLKILDFGLAKVMVGPADAELSQLPTEALTQEGVVLGTVPYMSPEQISGRAMDHRTDVFSLGIILYEMATGSRPFTGENSASLAGAILHLDPPLVTEVRGELPNHLSRIVRHCLEKAPDRRYQTSLDVRNELEELGEEVSTGSYTAASDVRPAPAVRMPRIPLRPIAWVGGGLAVAVAAILGWQQLGARGVGTAAVSAFTPNRVLVAEFENRTGDATLDYLGVQIADTLTSGIAEIKPELDPVSGDTVNRIEVQPAQRLPEVGEEGGTSAVRELAEATGSRLVISGSLYPHGQGVEVQWRAVDAEEESVVYSAWLEVEAGSDFVPVVEEMRQRVVGLVATLLRNGAPEPGWQNRYSLPPFYSAYREFTAGWQLIEADPQKALDHFRSASALDAFYPAPEILSVDVLRDIGAVGEASELLEMWARRRDELPLYWRYRLDAQQAVLAGRLADSMQKLRAWIGYLPDDPEATRLLPLVALQLNRPKIVFEVIDPEAESTYSWQPRALAAAHHLQGDFEQELAVARQAYGAFQQDILTRRGEVRALAALGRAEELESVLDEIVVSAASGPGTILIEAAQTLRGHGFRKEGLAVARRAAGWHRNRTSLGDATIDARFDLARAVYEAEQWDEAESLFIDLVQEADETLSGSPQTAQTMFTVDIVARGYLGALAARRRDAARARQFAAEIQGIERPFAYGVSEFQRARIEAVLGEEEEAVSLLRYAYGRGLPFSLEQRHHRDFESLRDHDPWKEVMRPKGGAG